MCALTTFTPLFYRPKPPYYKKKGEQNASQVCNYYNSGENFLQLDHIKGYREQRQTRLHRRHLALWDARAGGLWVLL